MEKCVVNSKGQIVIPLRLRKIVGIKNGTRVYLEEKNGHIIIHPATSEFYQNTFSILKGTDLVKNLEKRRRDEQTREKRNLQRR